MAWKLIDKQDRSVLGEGRSQGIGYAFAKRKGNTLTTSSPISPCKDYLNDSLYSEITGKPYSACGLNTTKQDIFDTHAYLIMSVCLAGCRALKKYETYDKDVAALETNHAGMQKVINWLEDLLKIDGRTSIQRIAANQYVIIAPLFWAQATYLISLYTLIIRAALYYVDNTDIKAFLLNPNNPDAYMIKMAWPKVERMIGGEVPKQDFNAPTSWHGAGICYYPFPPDPKAPPAAKPPSPTPTMTFGYVAAAHTVLIPAVPKAPPIAPAQIAAAQKA